MDPSLPPPPSVGADNLWFLEELFAQYEADPNSVEPAWREYFAQFTAQTPAAGPFVPFAAARQSLFRPIGQPSESRSSAEAGTLPFLRQELVDQLIRSYRARGHMVANIDPLGQRPTLHPELDLSYHALTDADLDQQFSARSMGGGMLPLRQIVARLSNTYCRTIGVQFMHIDNTRIKTWLQEHMEACENRLALSREEQVRILTKLTDAETWETFVHRKFLGARRFSLEGAESLIPLLDTAIEQASGHGVKELVIGMAHRGRLNVLVNILGKSAQRIFEEFDDKEGIHRRGHGDVKYHLGHSSDRVTSHGKAIHLSLCFNPSHLEFVGPVAAGRVRAKQDRAHDSERKHTLPIVIHGDAAFAGQGVVQEMLNMSDLPGYHCGGTVHIIVNNQVGFTTPPELSRSSPYATDVARMLEIPIFHVNGEDPEGVAQTVRLALEFRAAFGRDVIIDMYCYRRLGHNEGDEPNFTQPVMYQWINKQPTVREVYTQNLIKMGGISAAEAEEIVVRCRDRLEEELAHAKSGQSTVIDRPVTSPVRDAWQPYSGGADAATPDVITSLPQATLSALMQSITQVPATFRAHSKIVRLLETRREMGAANKPLDWGAAETLAYASLLNEGVPVRLSGQDSGRGTFSHRHAVLHDSDNGAIYTPLQHISKTQGTFGVWDSPLSEVGVLGFDYGYSIDYPDALVLWEAQYGDFANGAQVIIDQFIAASEQKWNRLSGMVMLLPHGFEGAGPEHSSARLERFLSLAAEDSMQVAQPTTPAQIFHLLRRQVHRKIRKPLIVMSPKSLLRLPAAVSTLEELSEGSFKRVLGDSEVTMQNARKVVLCSGKIYYDLVAARAERGIKDVAIARMEQIYPNPERELLAALDGFDDKKSVMWVQEEPRNMGAWPHLSLTYGPRLLGRWAFSSAARQASASPATGSGTQHKKEQASLMDQALS
jgi:2-oxoglutarate dehydrogenase E1 component